MIKILYVLMGASSVGKDKLANELKNKYNYGICVSFTSRPKRILEIDSKDYFFISELEFLQKLNNNEFLETRNYPTAMGTWHYGLDKKSVDINKTQLVILDAQGYRTVLEALGQENVVGIYIYATEREKVIRALNREPNREDIKYYQELYRRMLDDLTAFNTVKNDNKVYKVKNENGEFDKAIREIWNIINNKNQFNDDEIISEVKDDFKIGDLVRVTKILNKEKANHLIPFINSVGNVYSYIIMNENGEKRYKVIFSNGSNQVTAYFRKNEIAFIKPIGNVEVTD